MTRNALAAHTWDDDLNSMKPLPGLFEMLDWCDETGVKKIIVTNAPRLDGKSETPHTLMPEQIVVLCVGHAVCRG